MSLYDDDDTPIPTTVDWTLWRRLLRHAVPYRGAAGGMVVTGLLVAVADTGFPLVTARLIDEVSRGTPLADLVPLGVLLAGFFTVIGGSVYVFITCAGRISTGVAHDLRRAGFAQLQRLPFSFFDKHATGWLVSRLTSDCTKVSSLLPWLLLDLVWGSSLLLGITVAMLWLQPLLAGVVLLVVPPLVAVSVVFQRKMLESSRRVRRSNARLTASFTEAIAGVRTTKALAREAANLREFQQESRAMQHHATTNAIQGAVYLPLVMSLGSVGLGLALWQGGLRVEAGLSVGTLVAFMQYATLFAMPIQEMARQLTQLQAAQAAAERVQGLLETVPELRSPEHPTPLPAGPIRELSFDDVDFAYDPDNPVLDGCRFTVRAGETIALVGPTGEGKSTIVKLLARFYDVTGGAVRVDGIDVRDLSLRDWQRRFGFVLQDPHLFKGTVADNLRYGKLDATDDELRAAAALVHADRFIDRLPDGYDTDVGEGGARLSTGQRQLVSMARAVLADPAVFVMDEATSSVDMETERAIQAGVDALLSDRIAFVIAHRLSTIRAADRILVVSGGRIVEQGDHDALMAARGRYWALQQHQASRVA